MRSVLQWMRDNSLITMVIGLLVFALLVVVVTNRGDGQASAPSVTTTTPAVPAAPRDPNERLEYLRDLYRDLLESDSVSSPEYVNAIRRIHESVLALKDGVETEHDVAVKAAEIVKKCLSGSAEKATLVEYLAKAYGTSLEGYVESKKAAAKWVYDPNRMLAILATDPSIGILDPDHIDPETAKRVLRIMVESLSPPTDPNATSSAAGSAPDPNVTYSVVGLDPSDPNTLDLSGLDPNEREEIQRLVERRIMMGRNK